MSVLWTKLYQHRPGRSAGSVNGNEDEKITEQARFLGHRYISRKMRRASLAMGTASLKQVKNFEHRIDEHTTLIICQLIEALEQLHPETYSNISTNMLISNFNERQLCQDFSRFAEELFQNGIKWSFIMALFAFCGGLAEECARHGCSRTMLSILNWIQCFTSLKLSLWIKEQGGWAGLVDNFRNKSLKNESEKQITNIPEKYLNILMTEIKDLSSLNYVKIKLKSFPFGIIFLGLIVLTMLVYLSFSYSAKMRKKEL